MKRIARISAYIFLSVVVLVILGTGTLVFCMPALGERGFRDEFAKDRDAYVCRTDMDRALSFGGREGLPRLRRLSGDQSIAPAGRKVAAALVDYLQSGKHVDDLKHDLDLRRRYGFKTPLYDCYATFVIWKDGNQPRPEH